MSDYGNMSSEKLWAEFDQHNLPVSNDSSKMWERRLEKADAWYKECKEAFWEAQNNGYSVGDIEQARERLIRAQEDIDDLRRERRGE